MADNRNTQNWNQDDSNNQNADQRNENTQQGMQGTEQRTSNSPLSGQDREQQSGSGRGETGRETGFSEQNERSGEQGSDRNEDASI